MRNIGKVAGTIFKRMSGKRTTSLKPKSEQNMDPIANLTNLRAIVVGGHALFVGSVAGAWMANETQDQDFLPSTILTGTSFHFGAKAGVNLGLNPRIGYPIVASSLVIGALIAKSVRSPMD